VDQKNKDKKEDLLPWGWIKQKATADNIIQQTAWKDNALVLMMSTIHEASTTENTVNRLRRRPAATSTSAKTSRVPFQGKHEAYLDIPALVDDYNHNMGAVDQADQLWANNPGTCQVRQGGWHAL
jgi:hypothetical protein